MKSLSFVLLFLTISCSFATQEGLERKLNAWHGQSEQALIDKLGPPDSAYELNGKKYLSFISSSSGYVPATANSYVIGNSVQTQVYGGYSTHWWCKTIYIIENGIIIDAGYEGNACKA